MLNDDLDMTQGTPRGDLRQVLAAFTTDSLVRLIFAARKGRLIRREYSDNNGNGCVMFCLDPQIDSKPRLLNYSGFDEETLLAARRLVRHWDLGNLDDDDVDEIVADEILKRRRINRQEDEAVRRVELAIDARCDQPVSIA